MINSKGEIGFTISGAFSILTPSLSDSVLIGAEDVFRPEIARAQPIGTTEQPGCFFRPERREYPAESLHFVRFAEGHADVASQGIIASHTFIGALDKNYVLLAAKGIDYRSLRKWANDIDVNGADLRIALLTEVIAGRIDIFGRTAQGNKNGIRVLSSVLGNEAIMPAG